MRKLLSFFFLFSLGIAISAQVITPFTVRKSITQKGGILYLSNTASKAVPDNIVQNEMPPAGTGYDNNFTNGYVDIDGDASTFMSSSDQLNLPDCSEISWAGLYWGADCSSGDENFATRNQVKLKVNSGAYINLTADYLKDNTVGFRTYHCFKDISSIVKSNGLTDRYTIANVASDISGKNLFGGWTIVIIYRNNTQTMRNLTVFDGLASVSAGTYSTVDIPISGFQTPLNGPVSFELGLVSYDGDRSLTGDQLLFKGGASFINISDAIHPVNDIFNSTISKNGSLTSLRNPGYNNTLGYDANIFSPNNSAKNYIGNNAISATIRQTTGGETYLTQVVTSAIDVYEPDLRSAVRVKNITHPLSAIAEPGDILEYTVNGLNIGSDPSVNTFITDTIEGNAHYIPGSLKIISGPNTGAMTDAAGDDQAEYNASTKVVKVRIGTGANNYTGGYVNNSPTGIDSTQFSFRVTVTTDCVYLACDAVIDNSAHITGTGNISGNTFDNESNPGVFDSHGCPLPGTTKTPVNISGCSAPGASVNTPICKGGVINLTASESPSAIYFWTGPNGFTSSQREPVITNVSGANAGTYTANIYITGTDCHFVYQINADISIANAGPDQTGVATCGLTTVTLSGNNPALTNGIWSIISGTGGSFGAGHTATSTVPNSTFNGVSGNNYILRWTLNSSTGCDATTDDVSIELSSSASSAVLSATSATCNNRLNVALTGGVSPFSLTIDNGVGTISNYTSGNNIPVNPLVTTSYNLISVTGANGCSVSSITGSPATITVNNSIGTGTITANTLPTQPVVTSNGPNNPGSAADGGGSRVWNNPGFVVSSNNEWATNSYSTSGSYTSNYLKATNFGMNVPSDAVIVGIELKIERKASRTDRIKDNAVELLGGTGTSSNLAQTAVAWGTSDGVATYGGPAALWNMTWTAAQINSSSFGMQMKISRSSGTSTSYVDNITIKVYYTSSTSLAYCDNVSNASYTATGFTNTTTYAWTAPAGASIVSGQGTATAVFDLNGAGQSGNYTVVVTPSNDCGSGTPASLNVPITDCPTSPLSVRGNVYWDKNGSTTLTGKVDGTGIGVAKGSQLNVTLVSGTTAAKNSVAVNSNGTYIIPSVSANTAYTVVLSKNSYTTGQTPVAALPADCSFNGEKNNDLTNSLSGNDGTVDGKVSVPGFNTNNDINVNFGIKILTNPVANNDVTSTNEDTPVTYNVATNDTDTDGSVDPSTVVLGAGSDGTWSVNGSGIVSYTPSANFNGTASITYTIKDFDLLVSNSATLTITVNPVNDAPVATASSVTTDENTAFNFSLSDFNFTDVESNTISGIKIASLPASGNLTLNGVPVSAGDNIPTSDLSVLSFSPLYNEFATPYTSFTFRVNDADQGIVAGTMTINVNHIPSPPVAVNDIATTDENSPVTIDILSNDTNFDGSISSNSVDLDPLTALQQTTFTLIGQGTFTDNGTGNITFTPLSGYYGSTTPIAYTVKNSLGLTSNTATLTVTVKPLGAPVAVNDNATTNGNTSVSFCITANDYSAANTINPSRVDLDPVTPGIQQSYYADGKGLFSVDMLGYVTFQPDWNFNGIAIAEYTVKDNLNLISNIAVITVTVLHVNAAPFAVDDFITTNEDTPVTFNISTNDYDTDGTIDVSTIDLDPSTAGKQTVFSVTGEGSYSVNPAGNLTFTPALNFNGNATTVYYTLTDNEGLSSDNSLPAAISITVKPVNDAPVAVNDNVSTLATLSVSYVSFNIFSNDYDIDGTIDPATADLDPLTPGRQTTFTVSGEGTYSIDNAGNVNFEYSFATPVTTLTSVKYAVTDNLGLSSNTSNITITILSLGTPITANDNLTTNEDVSIISDVTANDSDNEGTNPGIDPGTLTLVGTLTTSAGTWSIVDAVNNPGEVMFVPAANFSGTASIGYTVKDLDGNLSNQSTINLTILPVNDAPSFTAGSNQTVCENSGVHSVSNWIASVSTGPANESGQSVTYIVTGNTNISLFSDLPAIDPSGILSFTPALNHTGTATITVIVQDNGGTSNGGTDVSASQTFTITVEAPGSSPVVSLSQPSCAVATGTITVTAPTGAGTTYSIDGIDYTNTTGIFTSLAVNSYTVTAKSAAGCISAGANVTINAQPATPAKPTLGSVTQPTCSVATGSFDITNYNAAYTYVVSPSTGVSVTAATVTAPAGTYTVTATLGACTSVVSSSVTVDAQPATPAKPTLGSVTQPTCSVATGSFDITNYNAAYTYVVTPSTGVSVSAATVTAPAGTYTVTATLGACTSVTSSPVTVDAQPATPAKPTLGSVTQPTCSVATGSFDITNYNAAYTYIVTPSTGVSVSAGTVTAPAGTYTVTATLGACTSVVSSSVKVDAQPATPSAPAAASSVQTFCTGSLPSVNELIITGTNIRWYNASAGGTILSGSDLLINGNIYYASQTAGGCESATRTSVSVILKSCTGPDIMDKTLSLDENSVNGTPVYDVNDNNSNTDSDADGLSLLYIIVSGNSSGAFLIDGATGEIKVSDASKLDFEVTKTFELIIHADNGTNSDQALITINLNNLNDNSPVIAPVAKTGEEDKVLAFAAEDFTSEFSDQDGNTLVKIKITSLPLHGVLKLSGLIVKINDEISLADLTNLTFEPDENWNGNTEFTWMGSDGSTYSPEAAVNINILAVNDAPVIKSTIPVLDALENSVSNTLNIMPFVSDNDGDQLSFTVTVGAGHGAVTADASGKFTYTPETGYAGKDSLTFTVCDNGNPSLCTTGKILISVVAVNLNHAPELTDIAKSIVQGQNLVFELTDFASAFADQDNDNLSVVKILSLPLNGTLKLSGANIAAGDEIQAADLSKIEFTPDKNFYGLTDFGWNASDGKDYSVSSASVTITVTKLDLFIPEGFSPNGDGVNDLFVINGTDQNTVSLKVFNRWGNIVYENRNYTNDWDGISNTGVQKSSKLPDGTYYYIINLNNGEKQKMGYITINK